MIAISKNQATQSLIAVCALIAFIRPSAVAGPEAVVYVTNPPPAWDWCETLSTKPGLVYRSAENPLLREFLIDGRYQYQAAHLDGSDVNGDDFHSTYQEHRRFRLGAKAKFANHLTLRLVLNLVNDGRRSGNDLDWGYNTFDEMTISYDIGKALGAGPFDSLVLNYGRQKFVITQEARESSARLFTVERSAISNRVYEAVRPTGFTLDAKSGDWSYTLGYYGAGREGGDNGFLSGFHRGGIYFAHAGWQASDELLLNLDTVYNDAGFGTDSVLSYRWAVSLNAQYDPGPWGVIADVVVGDNGSAGNGVANTTRQGAFWGAVVMPYFWIVGEKLQGVVQYQYGGAAEENGVRVNSRYGRSAKNAPADVNGGRGDRHHSVYAGLNYYLCGHNAKIQGGVEYQTMDTPVGTRGEFDTLTWLVAFRSYF